MNLRERLQLSYKLAFFPPLLNRLWGEVRDDRKALTDDQLLALDDAARLHLALPETGYASQRALERLALYQARSRAYGMPRFIRNVRELLGRPSITETSVPGHLVRDIAIPKISRKRIHAKMN